MNRCSRKPGRLHQNKLDGRLDNHRVFHLELGAKPICDHHHLNRYGGSRVTKRTRSLVSTNVLPDTLNGNLGVNERNLKTIDGTAVPPGNGATRRRVDDTSDRD